MRIAVLGATGLTGRQIVVQALDRGHDVVALARTPAGLAGLAGRGSPSLMVVRADVFDPGTVRDALTGVQAVLSGLGLRKSDDPETLVAGAQIVAAAGVERVVWLGALGTGVTRGAAGPLIGPIAAWALRHEQDAKVRADDLVRAGGGAIVHAGPLTSRAARGRHRLVPAGEFRPRLLPPSVSRADLAALMLDEATTPRLAGATAIPVAA